MIKIKHNLDSSKFKWLWSKYVTDGNDEKHCTNSLKGKYSKNFSKHNENFNEETTMVFDEQADGTYKAIYICGVINRGYTQKKNYPHNVHAAIIPRAGVKDVWEFEGWRIEVENGFFDKIPEIEELPEKYKNLPDEYVTCRIFRWAIGFFFPENERYSLTEEEAKRILDTDDFDFVESMLHIIHDSYEQSDEWQKHDEYLEMLERKNKELVDRFFVHGDADRFNEEFREFLWGLDNYKL